MRSTIGTPLLTFASLGLLLVPAARARDSISISFDELDARSGPRSLFDAGAFYLSDRGINPFGWSIGTDVLVVDGTHAPGGLPVHPYTADNYLTQVGVPGETLPDHIGMAFDPVTPVRWFGFTRCAFEGTSDTPFTHPAFSVWGFARRTDVDPTVVLDYEAVTATTLAPALSLRMDAPLAGSFERVIVWSHTVGASIPGVCLDQIMMQTIPAPSGLTIVGSIAVWVARRRRA